MHRSRKHADASARPPHGDLKKDLTKLYRSRVELAVSGATWLTARAYVQALLPPLPSPPSSGVPLERLAGPKYIATRAARLPAAALLATLQASVAFSFVDWAGL